MNRVVITNAAVVSSIAMDIPLFWLALKNGHHGLKSIEHFDTTNYPTTHAGEVRKDESLFNVDASTDRKEIFLRKTLLELIATSKLFSEYLPTERYMNVGVGIDYFELENYVNQSSISACSWLNYSHNTKELVDELACEVDIRGIRSVNVSACVASTQAIGHSFRMLSQFSKRACIVTGGVDSMINPLHYIGFYKLGALSQWTGEASKSCRPFDRERSGLVLGEGAALFEMCRLQDVEEENILAEVIAYASTMDGHSVTDPLPDGSMIAEAALKAISEANVPLDEIDCVHLHGTGTIKNDLAETNAMKKIFGDRYLDIPVFSLKGQTGHLIAACGAVELLACIFSLQEQEVPVTINCENRDSDIDLFIVKDKPLKCRIRNVLKLNAAFGGQNSALVLRKYEP